jgi:hypothetical protein
MFQLVQLGELGFPQLERKVRFSFATGEGVQLEKFYKGIFSDQRVPHPLGKTVHTKVVSPSARSSAIVSP